MRAILSKVVAVSMIASAGLLVTACKTETAATVNNATTTEDVPMENGMTDEMVGTTTNADAATGNGTLEAAPANAM